MAQTKKKRRRKHKGTQGGRVDSSRRAGRPRSREEAKARARAGRKSPARTDAPPTWRGSVARGAVAAVLFTALLMLIFKRPPGASFALGAFMLIFYIPAGYYIDTMLWRRRERERLRGRKEQ